MGAAIRSVLLLLCLAQAALAGRAYEDLPQLQDKESYFQVLDMKDGERTFGLAPKDRLALMGGDHTATKRLLDEYAPVFGTEGWDNYDPAAPYRRIVIDDGSGRRLVLKSRHPLVERDPELVLTSSGVAQLAGRSRDAVLGAGDPAYLRKRYAFDEIADACAWEAEKHARSVQLTYEENLKNQQRYQSSRYSAGGGLAALVMLALAGLAWVIPGLGMVYQLGKKGRQPLGWTLALCALSPLGWAALTGWQNVRGWMPKASVAAAYGLFLASLAAGAAKEKAPWLHRWSAAACAAAVLAYGIWTTDCGFSYEMWSSMRASNEGAMMGRLSSLRSAVAVYEADHFGMSPPDIQTLVPRYIKEIPYTSAIFRGGEVVLHAPGRSLRTADSPDDKAGWGYSPEKGLVYINCTHLDVRERTRLCDY